MTREDARALCEAGYMPLSDYLKFVEEDEKPKVPRLVTDNTKGKPNVE